jgi:hypothetical protein
MVTDERTVERPIERTGGCVCGALRWRATGEPMLQGLCHCRSCQRISGSGHVGWIAFPQASVTVTGTTRSASRIGGSGRTATRFSCPACLAVIYGTAEVMPGMINLYAGSLDDPAQFQPTIAVFVGERPPWDDTSRGLICYDTVPSR